MIVLPYERPFDHFNIGDRIVVYIEKHNGWYNGTVKAGYRHHDGCVSYELDNIGPRESDPNFQGYWGCGIAVPSILKEDEMAYFLAYPQDYIEWFKLSQKEYTDFKFHPINDETLVMFAKSLLS